MYELHAVGRRLVLDEAGQIVGLGGRTGPNRVGTRCQPLLRLVALTDHRVELRPHGSPEVQASEQALTMTWSRFETPEGFLLAVQAVVDVTAEAAAFVWRLRLTPGCDLAVVEALFPVVAALTGDVLYLPHHAGERIKHPARALITADGTHTRELAYCGRASMAWMELDGPSGGIYLGAHDPGFGLAGLWAQTDGESLALGIRRYCAFTDGTWATPPAVLLPHEGDWHTGAAIYRNWLGPLLPAPPRPPAAGGWTGLNPHSDFKRGGTVRHRFSEIPALYEAGEAVGLTHLVIAGWNRGGYLAQYPEYYPDMELGTALELADGCRYVREHGGAVTLHLNARAFDMESEYYPALGAAWAAKDERGQPQAEIWEPHRYAVMCPECEHWRHQLVSSARWLLQTTGCQGLYLDQVGSAAPYPCYDPAHGHRSQDGFNRGQLALLDDLRGEAALMAGNCGDIYGSRVWGSLAHSGREAAFPGEFCNLYRYTFPEHQMIGVVHPRRIDDPQERTEMFYRDLGRAWTLGSLFWAAPESRFRAGDERLLAQLQEALGLRRAAEPYFGAARFVDREWVRVESGGTPVATSFEGQGFRLVAVANPETAPGELVLPEPPAKVTCMSLGQPGEREWPCEGARIPLPRSRLSLLVVR